VIIFAGRFQPQKNLSALVDALEKLRDLEWSCILMGDGPQRSHLEDQIAQGGLRDRVQLTGWIDSDEVWRRMGESDILAMPSLSEGLPVVGIHALAQGLAIVAYKAGGLIDLVEDGVNGRLCAIGDQECFQDALMWCLRDRDRLMGLKRASRLKAEEFDIRRVAEEYERVFLEVTP
jgi:glycosyltransferase involved in cell wall biosynthesis